MSTDTISPKTGSSVAIANDSGQNLSTTKLNTNSIQGISGADLTLIPASSQKISLSGNTEVAGTFETSGLLSANNGLTVKGNSLYLNDGTSNKITLNTNGTATFGGLITATSGISTNTIQPYSGNAIQIAKQANQYISTNKLNTTLVGGSNLTLQETTGNNSISLTTNGILLTGDVTVGGTLNATGNFAINTNKFFVDSTDGDVIVGGTLDVGNIKSNTITIEEQTSTGTKNKLA